MARRLLVGVIVAVLMAMGLAPAARAATPTALLVPQATAFLPGAFTYAAPVIAKVGPVSGPSAGGTRVVITGTNLFGVTGVTFGSTAAVIVKGTATSVTVVAPPGVGVVDVSVSTAAGTGTRPAGFTYL